MTDRLAIVIVVLLLLVGGVDAYFNDATGLVFLGRKLIELIEYLAFWR